MRIEIEFRFYLLIDLSQKVEAAAQYDWLKVK